MAVYKTEMLRFGICDTFVMCDLILNYQPNFEGGH